MKTISEIFGLSANQIKAQSEPVAPKEPQSDQAACAVQVDELFKSTYDAKGPEGLLTLAYSAQSPEVQTEMKGMLETDPDGTIELMVQALTANPEACAAWLAFTSELPVETVDAQYHDDDERDEDTSRQEEAHPEGIEEDVCPGCGCEDCECPEVEVAAQEPEFKVGDAIEPIDAYGVSGKAVMVSGIKHGSYLHGYGQAKLGDFRQVEASYRKVGTAKTAQHINLDKTQGWANEAYGRWTHALLEENKADANQAYEEIRGYMERNNIEPAAFYDAHARKQFFQYDPQTGMLSKTSKTARSVGWGIQCDSFWLLKKDDFSLSNGNWGELPYEAQQPAALYASEAEALAAIAAAPVGEDFFPEDSLEVHEIEEESDGFEGKVAQVDGDWVESFDAGQWTKDYGVARGSASVLHNVRGYVNKNEWELWLNLTTLGQSGVAESVEDAKDACDEAFEEEFGEYPSTHRGRIAVDQKTLGYFQSYFGAYGAMLTRPLAFKKSARFARTASDIVKYRYFVVDPASGDVLSGWETLSDANDGLQDTPSPDQLSVLKRGEVPQTKLQEFLDRNDLRLARRSLRLAQASGDTVLVCPYCGDGPKSEDDARGCCGESSGHYERIPVEEFEKESKKAGLNPEVISVDGYEFVWINNPNTGVLDLYEKDESLGGVVGEHIGQAPDLEEAKKFLKNEVVPKLKEMGKTSQQLHWFRFKLDNGNVISVEAIDEQEALEIAERNLGNYDLQSGNREPSKIVKSLGKSGKKQAQSLNEGSKQYHLLNRENDIGISFRADSMEQAIKKAKAFVDKDPGAYGDLETVQDAESREKRRIAQAYSDPSSAVTDPIDKKLERLLQENPGMTLPEAATQYLASKEGWYKQTPEGEYLMRLTGGRKEAGPQEIPLPEEIKSRLFPPPARMPWEMFGDWLKKAVGAEVAEEWGPQLYDYIVLERGWMDRLASKEETHAST